MPGPTISGPLPAELMEYGRVGAGVLTASKQPSGGRLHQVHGRSGRTPLLRKAAMEPLAK
jgi:hypothetical protein